MTFVTTGLAIAGALAIGIPILIHLLARQRRKPIEWAAMRFLIEAFRKHKRRLQLEQLILLAVRCLIVGLLGLALARPVLEATGIIPAGGSRAVYIVMDDGLVSGVTGEDGKSALDKHVRQAVDLVNALGPGDAVGVITAARPARALLSPPSTDRNAVVDLLKSLTPTQSPTDLGGAINLVRGEVDDARQSQSPALVYLFSEFRGGSASLESSLPTTQVNTEDTVRLLATPPAAQTVSNVQVVSIEPVRSVIQPGAIDGSGQITVRLIRSGGSAAGGDVSTVRLAADGMPAIAPKTVQWQPGQSQADVKFIVNFPAQQSGADRSIGLTATIDDDALLADNQRNAVVELRDQIRVLLVDRRSFGFERTLDQLTAGQWIRRALEPMIAAQQDKSPIQVVEVEPGALDVADTRTAEVAILPRPDLVSDAGWTALRQFVQRDGLLIIMPPAEVNVHQWTERLTSHLHLPWRASLEVARYDDGIGLAEDQPANEVLRLVSSELADLARPVLAYRVLRVERDPAQPGGAVPLLLFADGSPLVLSGAPMASEAAEAQAPTSPARGMVIYLAVAPELSWTNLPSKPLMVPLFQEMVRQGLSVIRAALQLQVGEQPNIASGPAAHQIVNSKGQTIQLDQTGRPQQPLDQAGVYVVQDQAGQSIGKVSVNIDAGAGDTNVQSAAAVSSWLNASGPWATFDATNPGTTLAIDRATSPLAGILLLIVLVLVLIETVLARRFSHAYTGEVRDQRSEVRILGRGSPLTSDLRPLTSGAEGAS